MIRKWIVNNFFSDIIVEKTSELNKCLMNSNTKLKEKLSSVEYPTTEKLISMLRGRRFTKEQYNHLKMIVEIGFQEGEK